MTHALVALTLLALLLALRFRRLLLARLLGLPSPTTGVSLVRDVTVRMPDGVGLAADLLVPTAAGPHPTLLVRTPYGRAGMSAVMRLFAEHGYHVLVQDVRGRGDSEGLFSMASEAADGRATLDWISGQNWYDGRLGTWGMSYLGYVQWALASAAPVALRAMVPLLSAPEHYSHTFPDGAFGLESRLAWIQALDLKGTWGQRSMGRKILWLLAYLTGAESRRLDAACRTLPLQEADVVMAGRPVPLYRELMASSARGDPYWVSRDHGPGLRGIEAPVHLVAGWYDLLLRGALRAYADLKAAGKTPFLTVGPWSHTSPGAGLAGLREGLAWFDAHLKGDRTRIRAKPVRIHVMGGGGGWRDLEQWPPPCRETAWHLQSGRVLAPDPPPPGGEPDRYRYDPSDPTPAVGGPCLDRRRAGPKDNRALEARPDVLCYTTGPLDADLEVMGAVRLVLYVGSSRSHTDFFGRLCDVHPGGRSTNVCDGLFRVGPGSAAAEAGGSLRIDIDMWATAYRFARGHRMRLQVSSGAHPRWSRNPGTGEPLATAMRLETAEQAVFHDAARPSALILPLPCGPGS